MKLSIDNMLSRVTMYWLMIYYFCVLLAGAVVLSAAGIMPYDPLQIVASTAYLVALCYVFNWFFATLFRVKINPESQFITALILASITGPFSIATGGILLFVAAFVAMGSKYALAVHKKHIFNPAAVGALFVALMFGVGSSWWVGNLYLFPIIIIGAFFILKKIDRLALAGIFLGTFFGVGIILLTLMRVPFTDAFTSIVSVQTIAPLLFFASIMLVEPITSPQGRKMCYYYGSGVALFFLGYGYFNTLAPYALELALLSGNIFALAISKDSRIMLTLKKKETIARGTQSFWFEPSQPIQFKPGQFMECQLAHGNPDDRGIRRYFTICSSPTEKQVMITTKFSEPSSTFKKELKELREEQTLDLLRVAGEFVLPKDPATACIFIAGGIGVTPFRSMIKYMLDNNISRPVTLFYSNKTVEDIAFKDIFQQAIDQGWLKVIYTVTEAVPYGWLGKMGYITVDMIKEAAPNYIDSMIYISGPQPMVAAFKDMIATMDVPFDQIKADYFPGYTDTHQAKG